MGVFDNIKGKDIREKRMPFWNTKDKCFWIQEGFIMKTKIQVFDEHGNVLSERYEDEPQIMREMKIDEPTFEKIYRSFKSEVPKLDNKRVAISPALRYEVLKRDNHTCVLCGKSNLEGARLEVDHIIHVSNGGTNDLINLRTTCFECNRGRGTKE